MGPPVPDVAPEKPLRMLLCNVDEDNEKTSTKRDKKHSSATSSQEQQYSTTSNEVKEVEETLMSSASSEEFNTLPRDLSLEDQLIDALSGSYGTIDDHNSDGDEANVSGRLLFYVFVFFLIIVNEFNVFGSKLVDKYINRMQPGIVKL